ncbi:MAG TPA: type II toxin-antitoxin system PemK/MazF family toxin [Verrucomicrobiales bacterium]|nr:type II toxin-antitoxin system PemK/MazF family toxin [Verrucomicrobiales bacterium]HIL70386.1 type II toxin-antitoxin system PemK/MazF family toxin [Verrucomicrobiota bacterium]
MVFEGDVVVAELPQADGMAKLRPVLVLRELPGFGDFLVCGISTQVLQAEVGFDVILDQSDERFVDSGLKSTSVVRLNFLASIPISRMTRHLGKVSIDVLVTLQSNLAAHLVALHKPEQAHGE